MCDVEDIPVFVDDIAWDSEIGVCSESLFSAMTDTRRRVKLYALNADRQWDDRGTGHVSSSYVDRLKGVSLLVRAESDGESYHCLQPSLDVIRMWFF
jgi:hypothetical protein